MKTNLFTALILVVLSSVSAFAQPPKPRFVHEVDLGKSIPKFLNSQGFLDPKFADAVAKPSKYYTDFYGVQALAATTKDGIKRDFVPKFAEAVEEGENSVTLKFKDGFSGEFYPNSTFKFRTFEVQVDHVEISGDTWPDLLKNLESFRNILRTNKLEKKYLIPNPFYEEELVVARQLLSDKKAVVTTTTLESFNREKDAILLYPEGVHGNVEGYEKLKLMVLDKQKVDWIALEMLVLPMQKDLDIYVKSAGNSPEYLRTRKVLLDYFKDSWNGRLGPKTTAEENYYFKIVEQMQLNKTRIIAVEDAFAEYIFFRYGETKFGGAVRSYRWAKALPKTGKGLIFGGSAHFTDSSPINFQDFLAMLNPKLRMFVLEPLKTRKSS